MERKIGEVFEYQGKKLQVKADSNDNSCGGCIFNGSCTRGDKSITGFCEKGYRDDKKDVIFVEVQEQKAEEPKERKVGETFVYEGKKLKVVQTTSNLCNNCYFYVNSICKEIRKQCCGECDQRMRIDGKPVIFVEVKDEPEEQPQEEQPQETEAVKERNVGETFEFEGKKLKVVETKGSICNNCYFECRDCDCENIRKVLGACVRGTRSDNKPVIFVEVTDEQPQEQAEQQPEEQAEQQEEPQKLNLCEILKYCPAGELFWSPMLGDVKFYGIDHTIKRVCVTAVNNVTWGINADGTLTVDDITSEDVMLYPSREQRDWTKVKYEPKKELPRTWEEFCKNYPREKGESHIDLYSEICTSSYAGYSREIDRDRNILPSKQAAEAHLALIQLHQLRDAWREGWVPDWKDDEQDKYSIIKSKGEYEIIQAYISRFLAFQDEKRADEFKDCFIDLIRKAGDLI